jgi:hypothetical protein
MAITNSCEEEAFNYLSPSVSKIINLGSTINEEII